MNNLSSKNDVKEKKVVSERLKSVSQLYNYEETGQTIDEIKIELDDSFSPPKNNNYRNNNTIRERREETSGKGEGGGHLRNEKRKEFEEQGKNETFPKSRKKMKIQNEICLESSDKTSKTSDPPSSNFNFVNFNKFGNLVIQSQDGDDQEEEEEEDFLGANRVIAIDDIDQITKPQRRLSSSSSAYLSSEEDSISKSFTQNHQKLKKDISKPFHARNFGPNLWVLNPTNEKESRSKSPAKSPTKSPGALKDVPIFSIDDSVSISKADFDRINFNRHLSIKINSIEIDDEKEQVDCPPEEEESSSNEQQLIDGQKAPRGKGRSVFRRRPNQDFIRYRNKLCQQFTRKITATKNLFQLNECKICHETFRDNAIQSKTMQHFDFHFGWQKYSPPGNSFYCLYCGAYFNSRDILLNHQRQFEMGTFPCSLCEKILSSREELYGHFAFHIQNENYKESTCSSCRLLLKTSAQFTEHILSKHSMSYIIYQRRDKFTVHYFCKQVKRPINEMSIPNIRLERPPTPPRTNKATMTTTANGGKRKLVRNPKASGKNGKKGGKPKRKTVKQLLAEKKCKANRIVEQVAGGISLPSPTTSGDPPPPPPTGTATSVVQVPVVQIQVQVVKKEVKKRIRAKANNSHPSNMNISNMNISGSPKPTILSKIGILRRPNILSRRKLSIVGSTPPPPPSPSTSATIVSASDGGEEKSQNDGTRIKSVEPVPPPASSSSPLVKNASFPMSILSNSPVLHQALVPLALISDCSSHDHHSIISMINGSTKAIGNENNSTFNSGQKSASESSSETGGASSTSASSKKEEEGEGKEVECSNCQKRFPSAKVLRLHQLNVGVHFRTGKHLYKLLPCAVCGISFRLKTFLLSHLEFHFPQDGSIMKCSDCNKRLLTKQDFAQHLVEAHLNCHLIFLSVFAFTVAQFCTKGSSAAAAAAAATASTEGHRQLEINSPRGDSKTESISTKRVILREDTSGINLRDICKSHGKCQASIQEAILETIRTKSMKSGQKEGVTIILNYNMAANHKQPQKCPPISTIKKNGEGSQNSSTNKFLLTKVFDSEEKRGNIREINKLNGNDKINQKEDSHSENSQEKKKEEEEKVKQIISNGCRVKILPPKELNSQISVVDKSSNSNTKIPFQPPPPPPPPPFRKRLVLALGDKIYHLTPEETKVLNFVSEGKQIRLSSSSSTQAAATTEENRNCEIVTRTIRFPSSSSSPVSSSSSSKGVETGNTKTLAKGIKTVNPVNILIPLGADVRKEDLYDCAPPAAPAPEIVDPGSQLINCPICETPLEMQLLSKHFRSKPWSYQCSICQKEYHSKMLLEYHIGVHFPDLEPLIADEKNKGPSPLRKCTHCIQYFDKGTFAHHFLLFHTARPSRLQFLSPKPREPGDRPTQGGLFLSPVVAIDKIIHH